VTTLRIDYDGRQFRSVGNSGTGEVGNATVFRYHQTGDIVWATYAGGAIRFGTLIAIASPDGGLDMRYQHLNDRGEFKSGRCRSTPELLPDGRLRLHEKWTWTESRDAESGNSVIEEVHDSIPNPRP